MSASLTVAVTSYNYGRWLGGALLSLAAQSQPPDAWYVVDDASTEEETHRILRTLPAERVHRREANGGAAACYQTALDLCQTEWLVYLDADDEMPREYLSALVATQRATGAGIVYADSVILDAAGNVAGRWTFPEWDPAVFAERNFISASALCRAEDLRRAGGWREVRPFPDWDLWTRVVALGVEPVRCAGTALRYRLHGASASHPQETKNADAR